MNEAPRAPGPVPEALFDHILYTGLDRRLTIQLATWGHCQVDYRAGHALGILTPELATRPDLVSRCLLDTLFTNLFIYTGFGMVHATGLLRDDRVLLLMAPHGTGKSTTALHLVLAGYTLISDSMIYLSRHEDELLLAGFPVGRTTLRADVLAQFPRLVPLLEPEPVRGETKYALDLRDVDPTLVCEEALVPGDVTLMLLRRHGMAETHLVPASRDEIVRAVMHNSLYYDAADVWKQNLAVIGDLLDRSRFHELTIGTAPERIVSVVNGLWDRQ